MTAVDQSLARISGRVTAIIEAIDRGEDPAPLVARLNQATPWEQAALGLAATLDHNERMAAADEHSVTG